MPERDPNFWQINWFDRQRERLAYLLAWWAFRDDLRDWYREGRP